MVRSTASTVEHYLGDLPDDRREAIAEVRDAILDNLPPGFVETMSYGMPTYEVAPELVPDDHDGPVMLAALASQKRHMAVYLTSVYDDPDTLEWFRRRYVESGKKLDMGKSCVRFRHLDQLPVDLVGEVVASASVDAMIAALADGGSDDG